MSLAKIIKLKSGNFNLPITNYLIRLVNDGKKINYIFLTGGKSLLKVYKKLFNEIKKKNFKIKIFLTDERCKQKGDKNLNERLFQDVNNFFLPIIKRNYSFSQCAYFYNKIVPSKPKFILLSIGEDGHIASIFSKSEAIFSKKKVIYMKKKYKKFSRITVTLKYLIDKKNIILFCKNNSRKKVLFKCLKNSKHVLHKLVKYNTNIILFFNKNYYKVLIRG